VEGAVAVTGIPETGMIGSHRFPTFRPDPTRLEPRYLLGFLRTEFGLDLLGRVSPGGAGRNRTLNRNAFLDQDIALPPLEDQQKMVARVEELASRIHGARTLRHQAREEVEVLVASYANLVLTNEAKRWPTCALEEVAEIRSGVTLGRRLEGQTVRLPYLRVANVQDGHLDLSEIKQVEVLESEAEKWRLLNGDLLLTEGGDWDKLGRGAVWRGEIKHCIHQNHIFCVRTRGATVLPEFLAALISSPIGKAYFQQASKQTTNLASINQRQLKAGVSAYPF
jgi:type I restriction enzyme S subunit